jgi:hypothetical protein
VLAAVPCDSEPLQSLQVERARRRLERRGRKLTGDAVGNVDDVHDFQAVVGDELRRFMERDGFEHRVRDAPKTEQVGGQCAMTVFFGARELARRQHDVTHVAQHAGDEGFVRLAAIRRVPATSEHAGEQGVDLKGQQLGAGEANARRLRGGHGFHRQREVAKRQRP